ncbi:alcohol dehydrogenase class IV [Hydrogenoanaerobacterium saccharovorans]|uniref:Alcohol dehydrogenase, class IV n=1 Tax=Hydrogenoanaerobacterium saccharovorans TaxID=474960 RepID=A0A1H7ZHF2_9FIRM|nr:1-propanol dehydrogenase PduQ [Hydrogenoanaerobacterium saccharovorans]RPF48596.1 alcohol dehydrogenase class IV [Hydrogenoanaerobacterium saccharovorans]SEM57725.1 Alcohol dehydrogenase, class IV [Hydrogenoanaerobacterium saccharovorans]
MNIFNAPTKIYMGAQDLSSVLKGSKRVFIVTDSFMAESGKVDYILNQLYRMGSEFHIFSRVTPDPDISIITKGVEEITEFKPDSVVAFGGGSPIDAAKAIVFFAGKVYDLRDCPFIAIPTTSGTGSEVTCFAVISDKEKQIKYPLLDDALLPDAAILDANLILSVPPNVTADTGIDVLTHAIEAYLSTAATDFSDAVAEKSIKLVQKHLLTAYNEPDNFEARQGMHNASCLAGMAFSNASLGLNHSMAHALGAQAKLPHGRANAILLPYVMSFNAGCTADALTPSAVRYAEIARILGMEAKSTRQSALNLIHTVRRFVKKLHLPSTIEAAGVSAEEFEKIVHSMAESALSDRCTATNPVECSVESIEKVYRKAFLGKLP